MLQALDEARFPEMMETYGGQKSSIPVKEQGVRVICRISLELDGTQKQVVQELRGEQDREFLDLARKLVDFCREPAQKGLAAKSMPDGLKMLAEGKLAGETLQLVLNRKADKGQTLAAGEAFLLHISRGRISIQPYGPKGEVGAGISSRLPQAELRKVAALLLEQRVSELPINLWAPGYTDLTVEVLGKKSSVQARPFAGMDAEAQEKERQRFLRIISGLSELRSSQIF
jgi:hypothetical protein